jgi:hypothetical protein
MDSLQAGWDWLSMGWLGGYVGFAAEGWLIQRFSEHV